MITSRELAKHIYEYVQSISEKKKKDLNSINDNNEINYISNLITLHFDEIDTKNHYKELQKNSN